MSSNDPDHGLDDVDAEPSEPLLDGEAEAIADAEQLETHLASLKAARRRNYIRLGIGTVAVLVFIGIFVRLSRWKRPFDCELGCASFLSPKEPGVGENASTVQGLIKSFSCIAQTARILSRVPIPTGQDTLWPLHGSWTGPR